MSTDDQGYRGSHSHAAKGAEYESLYANDPWSRFVWDSEQRVLREILAEHLRGGAASALDFACGTGRITAFLEQAGLRVAGVDVSESMLAEARRKVVSSELLLGDITVDRTILADRKFDLITAFRFFLNAEEPLRLDAMRALAGLLEPDGILVFNNHHHSGSPYVRLVRWWTLRRGGSYRTMSTREMRDLAEAAGLRVVALHPVGVVHVPKLKLSEAANRRIERLARRLPWAVRCSEVVIAVCERA